MLVTKYFISTKPFAIIGLSLAFLLPSCIWNDDETHYLDSDKKLEFHSGEKRVYESSLGQVDTIIFMMNQNYSIDVHNAYTDYYELQQLWWFFSQDLDQINAFAKNTQDWRYIGEDDRQYISETIQCADGTYTLQWQNAKPKNIFSDEKFDSLKMNGTMYRDVYIIRPITEEEEAADSTKQVRKVYYSPTQGLLKYFYTDGEVYELQEILIPI